MRKRFEVHSFNLGDVEDPYVFAAEPLCNWQQTELGKWVMDNAADTPTWHTRISQNSMGYAVDIIAEFEDEKITEWLLQSKI